MSGNKTDFVFDTYYAPHLMKERYKSNGSIARTRAIENMYFTALTDIAANRFKWLNMPDSVNPRFLEMTVYRSGLSVFYFEDRINKFLALRGSPAGQLNYNDDPVSFLVTGNSFISRTLHAVDRIVSVGGVPMPVRRECVPIWGNYTRTPDIRTVAIFASRLADMERSIEINAHNARRSKIIAVGDNGRLSARNINREIDEGSAAIEVSELGMTMVPTAIDMGINLQDIEKLDIIKVRQWNTCMSLLGINAANQDKKERLVASEVEANDEQIQSSKFVALNARKQAARAINKRWDLNIDVEYNVDIENQANSVRENLGIGVM